jgi:hypothetical protein
VDNVELCRAKLVSNIWENIDQSRAGANCGRGTALSGPTRNRRQSRYARGRMQSEGVELSRMRWLQGHVQTGMESILDGVLVA